MVNPEKWRRPFDNTIAIGTPFGVPGPKTKWKHGFHGGDDFLTPMRTPCKAAKGGCVAFAGNGGDGFGNYVRIDHGDGTRTYYTHLDEVCVVDGDVVMKGQIIGLSGNSGNVWTDGHPVTDQERAEGKGAHCHVEARDKNGIPFKMEYEEAKA